MKVKCIDNKNSKGNIVIGITIGKTYDVIDEDKYRYNIIWVINDYGKENWYHEECFKPLSEYRIEMINKLLENES